VPDTPKGRFSQVPQDGTVVMTHHVAIRVSEKRVKSYCRHFSMGSDLQVASRIYIAQ
jgi:hypothetical protein